MAASPSAVDPNPDNPDSGIPQSTPNPTPQENPNPTPADAAPLTAVVTPTAVAAPLTDVVTPTAVAAPLTAVVTPTAVAAPSAVAVPASVAPTPVAAPAPVVPTAVAAPPPPYPSFRPLVSPPVMQYPTYPGPYYPMPQQSTGIQPPGVAGAPRPGVMYGQPPVTPMYGNGYMTAPGAPYQPQQGMPMPPPDWQDSSLRFFKDLFKLMLIVMQQYIGLARYPSPYQMFRPGFPPRMPPMGVLPQVPRPPIPGVRPTVTPVVRPLVPIVAPPEKPQTTVYVGKIAPTVDNEFLLSLLKLCGPVKSWKRAQDPSDGTPKGFGFCEFEAAEGILRAMRLMSKLSIDGQELVLNINQATREYLERYVTKKTEREKLKETEGQVGEVAPGVQSQQPQESVVGVDESEDKENPEKAKLFGIVTDEDRETDRDAYEKIANMIEERIKTKPLPPPPPVQTPANGSMKSVSQAPSKSRDGDSDVDIMKSDAVEDINDDATTNENKPLIEHDKTVAGTPDKTRVHDRSSRERDKEHDSKREKEQELERYERERERERVRRERIREREVREADRFYRDRLKEWEAREREREYQRQKEREREKEHLRERRREILKDENESDDDDTRKRRRRSSLYEEKRRKRQREKEDDLIDRLKEEEEIAEAKRRAIEEQLSKDESKTLSSLMVNESIVPMEEDAEPYPDGREDALEHVHDSISGSETGAGIYRNNSTDEPDMVSAEVLEMKQNSNAPTRKLGFGLVGSGKRTTVPSVFHEEDDEGVDDKKMRPLVPIDYSTEELQAVQPSASVPSPNLAAAAEFAKRISGVSTKEDKRETERERSGRSNDRSNHRERDRAEDNSRSRSEFKERMHDRERERVDRPRADNKKLLDAKQLIDMIPKTKEELFAYEINWDIYDMYELHDRMKPWISKKITEFLGEEEVSLVEYIVDSTKDHVQASKMLELLQAILDEEAEMFVLKMWRMLIFEIMKVEAGLSGK